jgi:hypothetical protein
MKLKPKFKNVFIFSFNSCVRVGRKISFQTASEEIKKIELMLCSFDFSRVEAAFREAWKSPMNQAKNQFCVTSD